MSKRILVPLLNLKMKPSPDPENDIAPYVLSCFSAKIVSFFSEDLSDYDGVLESELESVRMASWWCLELNEYEGYKIDTHLLIIAFRILFDYPVSLHSYLYPNGIDEIPFRQCFKLHDIFRYEAAEVRNAKLLSREDLGEVERMFGRLKKMSEMKGRAHNALFLLTRGMFESNAIGAILHYSAALESIYGIEKNRQRRDHIPIAETISKRIAAYLAPSDYNYQVIIDMYELRSRVVHGEMHVVWDNNPKINVEQANTFWRLLRVCFLKLLTENHYSKLIDEQERENFFDEIAKKRCNE